MAKYYFWSEGNSDGRKMRVEFEFEDDTLRRCVIDGVTMSADLATDLLRLDEVHGPGYVPRGAPGSRLNALNLLRWDVFDREPEIGGDPGPIEVDEPIEGVIY